MKILHTADWHIGQRFLNEDREPEFQLFFDWLLEIIDNQNIELLLIAGDIFDVAYPSNSALQQYYKFLTQLQKTCCRNVVIISGNHDAISTLNAPKEILKFINVHIVASISENLQDEIIEIKNAEGKIELVVCAVPFLRDRDIRISKSGESYEERSKSVRDGILNHYNQLAELAKPYQSEGLPIFAMGHLFMTGVSKSDGERDIYIGNLSNIESKEFPEVFDYIALGHIHRPQIIDNKQHIRYSGSPLQMSFSERKDTKQVLIIEIAANKTINIESIEVPAFRKLVRFKGTYADVTMFLKGYESSSSLKDWGEISITDENPSPSLIVDFEETRSAVQTIEILKFSCENTKKNSETESVYQETIALKDLAVSDVFEKLIEKENRKDSDSLKLSFKELVENLHYKYEV